MHPPSPTATAALMAAALLALGARAQTAEPVTTLAPTQAPCDSCGRPIAQAASQSLPVAPALAASAFRLNDLRLNGAQALPSDDLKAITQPYIGRDVTLGDLEALAQAITAQYRARGFFLATAIVPVQTVRDGIVEISVIEGRLGKVDVTVAPDAPLSEARVRGFLSPLQRGDAVNAPVYERAMLLLSDQPGVRVSSGLQEGTQTGTTDLSVEVVATPRFSFAAEADNHGTKESGRYRIGGTARWLSPFGIGDNLDARVMVSNGNALQFGRLAYEAPIGTSGLRAGVGISRVSYELGGEFEELGAQGKANVLDFSLNYPLIRQRQQNLLLRLSADAKDLTDSMDAVDFESRKRVNGVGLGWTWERRDDLLGGGYWASSGTLYHGSLAIRDAQSLAFDQAVTGHRTEGGFSKLSFQLSRLQAVVPSHSLYLSLGGQWASKNLDASEKLSLGGARAVRAYSSSEALVDQGLIGTVEWRWSFNNELTPFLFYDASRGKRSRAPTLFDEANGISLRGYGVGLSWSRPGNFSINATVAWRDGTRPAQSDGGGRNPRLYVQAQKSF
ncbi:ShlB/FhaC/HecB family hemolysin secretion/activation protein [Variovorax sp. PAMC 28711]|uniref:ShlB/FhaC/HecB family hemolysin secretion/activation protein n=1 Tax=Variovorax sp. PAMC 28711 TaxID=1795631 RepID=UPI000AAA517A|nr:ShlB/FhaC/HecB family hemolysin secretion/activation protein [Variovorax sp. PAMC 28711]